MIGVGQFDCIVVDYLHTRKFPSFTPYMRADNVRSSHRVHREGVDGINGSRLAKIIARKNGMYLGMRNYNNYRFTAPALSLRGLVWSLLH